MQSWNDIKKQMKVDVMANGPIARVDADGNVSLEAPDEFRRILDDFCEVGKRRARRNEAVAFAVLALSVALLAVANVLFPQWHVLDSVHLWYIPVVVVVMGFATSSDRSRKEARFYRDHLEEVFLKVARERYEAGQYHSISKDGVIDFDGDGIA